MSQRPWAVLSPSRFVAALVLAGAIGGCGGSPEGGTSDFVESLVRLLNARFVPSSVVLPRGASRTVDFEVTCDKPGLETPFGRLGIRVKLDPERRLPEGVTATLIGPPSPDEGGAYECNGAHPNPNLRMALLPVRVQAAANVAPTTVTLLGYVEIEPLDPGGPIKDSTRADLAVTLVVGEGTGPTG